MASSTSPTTAQQAPPFPPAPLAALSAEIQSLLLSQNATLSVAETACGGLLSSAILSTPGSSKVYRGGLTLYTLESRLSYAGWTKQHIADYRGPSTEIVEGMARHVRGELGSGYCLAESGTAGPTGGSTRNRTPGYVALAVVCERGSFVREVETGSADRAANMVRFAEEGLRFLKEVIGGEAKL